MDSADEIIARLKGEPPEVQRSVSAFLRTVHPVHAIEAEWRVPAEVILEAISRSSDLSKRGVRGLIAEAYFEVSVLPSLVGWANVTPPGNHAYDMAVQRGTTTARIQIKGQRRKGGRPMRANEAFNWLSANLIVTETQKTRAGTGNDGADTRPYRFGEFDVLAVNVEPSTGDWTQFRYTLERWLLPRQDDANLILKFQPVSLEPNDDWTGDLATCLQWLEGDVQKRIRSQSAATGS